MSKQLRLATVCMCSTDDKEKNIAEAVQWIREAAKRGADWVLLPEVFAYHGPYDQIYAQGENEHGPLLDRLSTLAKELKIVLFAGSLGERPGDDETQSVRGRLGHDRVYNTTYIFGRDGSQLAKYRKTHLFNLLGQDGSPLYCESDGFLAGDSAVVVTIDGFRVGLAICYDLRFPDFFSRLSRDGALDVIVLPSAFTLQTGMDHWELLLRARAVEQQAYVYAANQVGDHGRGKSSYGHSMIIDPWGYVLANTGAHKGLAIAEINHERIENVRNRLPALKNRRPEIYD